MFRRLRTKARDLSAILSLKRGISPTAEGQRLLLKQYLGSSFSHKFTIVLMIIKVAKARYNHANIGRKVKSTKTPAGQMVKHNSVEII